jgi:hypothetical protein
LTEIAIPEVVALQQRAKFFKDDGGADKVEITFVGSKDTFIKKVGPEEMARFKQEWDAYCDGRPMTRRPGIALTEVPGISQDKADAYIARNIHNAEELSVLTDGQCQSVGHGTLTDRKAAQAFVMERRMKEQSEQRDRVGNAAKDLKTGTPEPQGIAELGKKIDALTEGMTALVGLLTAQAQQKPARAKKEKPDAAG